MATSEDLTFVHGLRQGRTTARPASSDDPIAHIALDAGFADQRHFTCAFKRHTGTTPGRFRSLVRE